jgi:preprotein translocase subunit YajC
MLQAVLLWAEEEGPRGLLNPITIMMGLFFLFFFIVLLPAQRRQEKERLAMLAAVEKNDKVLTTGGIYGTIVSISDKEDELVVKVDDNVKLRMSRGSIARNLTKEEKARQAKEEKSAGK